jgi:hypothetical protein
MASKNTNRVTGTDSVRYIRVSSTGQVDTDYNPEGISYPLSEKRSFSANGRSARLTSRSSSSQAGVPRILPSGQPFKR